MNELEVRIWKELSNKLAWAIGSALGVPYAPGRSWARGAARELAKELLTQYSKLSEESTPAPGPSLCPTRQSVTPGPPALRAIEKRLPETWLPAS